MPAGRVTDRSDIAGGRMVFAKCQKLTYISDTEVVMQTLADQIMKRASTPVSYTHLTLPTKA